MQMENVGVAKGRMPLSIRPKIVTVDTAAWVLSDMFLCACPGGGVTPSRLSSGPLFSPLPTSGPSGRDVTAARHAAA